MGGHDQGTPTAVSDHRMNIDEFCSTGGCWGIAGSRGVCPDCYAAWLAARIAGQDVPDLPKPRAVPRAKKVRPPKPVCDVAGCDKVSEVKGKCKKHYKASLRPAPVERPLMKDSPCTYPDGCDLNAYSKGLCMRHYARVKYHENKRLRDSK
jgi:hypothetical protein